MSCPIPDEPDIMALAAEVYRTGRGAPLRVGPYIFDHEPMEASRGDRNAFKYHRFMRLRAVLGALARLYR